MNITPHFNTLYYGGIMSDFTEYIKLSDDSELSKHNNLGVEKCKAGEYDAGIASFNQAIRLFPNKRVLYANRAIAFQDMGFTLSAINDASVLDLLKD